MNVNILEEFDIDCTFLISHDCIELYDKINPRIEFFNRNQGSHYIFTKIMMHLNNHTTVYYILNKVPTFCEQSVKVCIKFQKITRIWQRLTFL